MIPKEAFWSITAVMVSAWAFGVVCDRLFSAWLQGHTDGTEDDTEDGTEADHDRWEDDPVPTNTCDTCKYEKAPLWDTKCSKCSDFNMWDAKE